MKGSREVIELFILRHPESVSLDNRWIKHRRARRIIPLNAVHVTLNTIILSTSVKFRNAAISVDISLCPSVSCLFVRLSVWNNLAPTARIFIKYEIWGLFENLSRKFNFVQNLKKKGYYTWRHMYILITYRWIFLRMRNVLENVVETIKTHILSSIPFPENRAVYEIMSESMVEPGRPQMTL
jgi:hypothetical protein